MARVFVALPLSEDARAEVARVARTLTGPHLRLVPPENLHITLAFLGEIPDVSAVTDALTPVVSDHLPAAVRLGSVGGFPTPSRARVVFVRVDDPAGSLERAATALRDALALPPVSWEPDRAFVPHVTVARAPGIAVPSVEVAVVAFEIASVQVMGSTLRGGRPPSYEVLAEIRSTGSAASA